MPGKVRPCRKMIGVQRIIDNFGKFYLENKVRYPAKIFTGLLLYQRKPREKFRAKSHVRKNELLLKNRRYMGVYCLNDIFGKF